MLNINRIIWKEIFIKKIENKHQVTMAEVDEILYGKKKVYRMAKGDVKGENVYLALGKTRAGRYLSVFFILKKNNEVLPISARDMDNKERRKYGHA
ncbi:MAG: BrnT family toxin [Candidatus Methanoperedens sp.]|nr:BrnT family toxin [Candidatus Methanoperedens sp.]